MYANVNPALRDVSPPDVTMTGRLLISHAAAYHSRRPREIDKELIALALLPSRLIASLSADERRILAAAGRRYRSKQ
jgi:hypothetical protein